MGCLRTSLLLKDYWILDTGFLKLPITYSDWLNYCVLSIPILWLVLKLKYNIWLDNSIIHVSQPPSSRSLINDWFKISFLWSLIGWSRDTYRFYDLSLDDPETLYPGVTWLWTGGQHDCTNENLGFHKTVHNHSKIVCADQWNSSMFSFQISTQWVHEESTWRPRAHEWKTCIS